MSDSSVNCGNNNVFVVILVLHAPRLSVLHAEDCAAITGNVVKRLASPNRVNCLSDGIGQSDRFSFLRSRERKKVKKMLRVQRTVRNGDEQTLF